LGRPGSIGCIRMNNRDLLDLFARAEPGTEVYIEK